MNDNTNIKITNEAQLKRAEEIVQLSSIHCGTTAYNYKTFIRECKKHLVAGVVVAEDAMVAAFASIGPSHLGSTRPSNHPVADLPAVFEHRRQLLPDLRVRAADILLSRRKVVRRSGRRVRIVRNFLKL